MRTALWALSAVCWLLPAQAFGQDEDSRTESGRWAPAVAVTGGVLVQSVSGQVASGDVLGPSFSPNPAQPIRPAASGESVLVPPFVGGDLELMSPGAASLPGSPRLFVHAGAAAVFPQTLTPAKEGAPGPLEAPPGVTGGIREDTVFGQGSQTSVENGPVVVTAGAGVAFTVDAFDRTIRIKPSVEYLWEELEVRGTVQRAVALTSISAADGIEDFRLIVLRGQETTGFHGLGPGLEVETDAAQAGPFMASVFVGAQFYAILGDRTVAFGASNEFDETAAWTAERDPWAYRAAVGLRLRWAPE
jgi:hypothetical protein